MMKRDESRSFLESLTPFEDADEIDKELFLDPAAIA